MAEVGVGPVVDMAIDADVDMVSNVDDDVGIDAAVDDDVVAVVDDAGVDPDVGVSILLLPGTDDTDEHSVSIATLQSLLDCL